MNNIREIILERIKQGEVAMRPRWQFVLLTVLWALGILITFLSTVYLLSFVLFVLSRTGLIFAPQFGWQGFVFFILASPWLLLSLVALFGFVLYLLIKHFSFSYRRSWLYSFVGIVLLVSVASALMHQIALHERLENFAGRHNIPAMSPFYQQGAGMAPNGLVIGRIVELKDDGLVLVSLQGDTVIVLIKPETKLPPRQLAVDDDVLVVGKFKGEVLEAYGIRSANDDRWQRRMEARPPQSLMVPATRPR
jgi:hypothetical protein